MQIARLFPRETSVAESTLEITKLCYDSRKVVPGSVFFALPGFKTNGLEFVREAAERGAVAVVADHVSGLEGVKDIVVSHPREVMADAADRFYKEPSRKLKVIGVTGTNGKTTVAFLIRHLSLFSNHPCSLLGTVANWIGEEVLPSLHTTPESIDLQELLARAKEAGDRMVVMEVSSHALMQERTRGTRFDAAVFTNLTQDHLDYHKTMEAYFEAKARLFLQLEGQTEKRARAILPTDDRYGARLRDRFQKTLPVVTYGLGSGCDFRASDIRYRPTGTTFRLDAQGRQFLVRLPLIGKYNVLNALAAVAACVSVGLDIRRCVHALAETPQIPGRLERVDSKRKFQVYIDYAHTPDALENVLSSLRDLRPSRLIVVFGCGGDRDQGKRPLMGRVAEQLADEVILTSDNPRSESPEKILDDIAKGFKQDVKENVPGNRVQMIADREAAIGEAVRMAGDGDMILIAGKGHEEFQEWAGEKIPFRDRFVAERAIRHKAMESQEGEE